MWFKWFKIKNSEASKVEDPCYVLNQIFKFDIDNSIEDFIAHVTPIFHFIYSHLNCDNLWLINIDDTSIKIDISEHNTPTVYAEIESLQQILLSAVKLKHHVMFLEADEIPDSFKKQFNSDNLMLYTLNHSRHTFICIINNIRNDDSQSIKHLKQVLGQIDNQMRNISLVTDYKHLAYYDHLTKLPNRILFQEKIQRILKIAKNENKKVYVALIDLDNFKRINDTLGHGAGDEYLKYIATRLNHEPGTFCDATCNNIFDSSCVKAQSQYITARLGGDEFVLAFTSYPNNIESITALMHDFHRKLTQPIKLEGRLIYPSVSVGVSMFPYDGLEPTLLLKTADLALYASKNSGKNKISFHHAELSVQAEEEIRLENTIQYFIDTADFDVYFQPLIDLKTKQLIGAEALFRGNLKVHPDINFQKLIKLAENTGLILELGKLILRKACRACKTCIANAGTNLNIAVNVSPQQLQHPDFVDDVLEILNEQDFPPENLTLEITENVIVENLNTCIDKLQTLSDKGVQIAIDDFGTGYSSLSYIKYLPITKLKIDIKFTSQMEHSIKDAEIIKAVISMAKTMGFETIAEGIENKAQVELLQQYKCDVVQGYLFGQAVNEHDFVTYIQKYNSS